MSLRLRPDQQRVVAYRRGYMAVPAVPGAGKTTVLAALAADLIAEGLAEPGRILIVTYTNSAVANFRSRIAQLLEERGCPRHQGYEVRTIHSLALRIVKEMPEAIGWSDNFRVLDEARQDALVQELTRRWIIQNRPLWESLLRQDLQGSRRDWAEEQWAEKTWTLIRNLIQTFKSRCIDPETALGLTRHLKPESALRWAAEVYEGYQRQLAMEGAVDFGDLMWGAYRLLTQEPELLARLQARWQYIFEDEAQDSYRLQERVLRLLAGPEGNLVRVGDANQAIMGTFTSAEPDLFRRFCREEGVAVRPLTMAGRSSRDIIALTNELVRWVREEYPEPRCRTALEDQQILPVPPGYAPANPVPPLYTIVTRCYKTYEEEMQQVARLAARSVQRAPEKTVAVLLPTRSMVASMAARLAEASVPVRQIGGSTAPERQRTILDLLAVLEFLAMPHEPERLLTALGHLMHLPHPEDAPFASFVRECRPEELFYPLDGSELFASLYAACPECRGDLHLEKALARLRQWLPQSLIPADELVVMVAGDLGLTGEELSIAHHLAVRVRAFLQEHPACGLPDVVHHLREELQAMGKFSDMLYDRQGFQAEPGVVYVATCHAAKGLEWDTVYVASVTRAEYPGLLQDKVRSEHWFLPENLINPEALALAELAAVQGEDPEGDPVTRAKVEIISERLRLLYVAITRARENLMLTCHRRDRWDKEAKPALALVHLADWIRQQRRAPVSS